MEKLKQIANQKRSSLKYHNQLFNDPNIKMSKFQENKHLKWDQKVEEHTIDPAEVKNEEIFEHKNSIEEVAKELENNLKVEPNAPMNFEQKRRMSLQNEFLIAKSLLQKKVLDDEDEDEDDTREQVNKNTIYNKTKLGIMESDGEDSDSDSDSDSNSNPEA